MPLKDLYLVLNGMNKLNDNSLNEIRNIKKQLNKNNWELFKKQTDISIISELLFIWLNDCVYNCIDPQKIENIIGQFISICFPKQQNKSLPETSINNNINNIDYNLLNNINNLFDVYIDNIENKDFEMLKKMIKIIKNDLSKLEYETIKYLSLFLQIIYPTNKFNKDSVNNIEKSNFHIIEYKRFLYKFSLFLLGYNLDKVNSTLNKFYKSKELLHSKMLIFIFELFIFYKNNNVNINDIVTNTIGNTLENEDEFFKNKDNIDFNSIKLIL